MVERGGARIASVEIYFRENERKKGGKVLIGTMEKPKRFMNELGSEALTQKEEMKNRQLLVYYQIKK